MKLLPHILFQKCIFIIALEMASPGNRHCAICIGTPSFPHYSQQRPQQRHFTGDFGDGRCQRCYHERGTQIDGCVLAKNIRSRHATIGLRHSTVAFIYYVGVGLRFSDWPIRLRPNDCRVQTEDLTSIVERRYM